MKQPKSWWLVGSLVFVLATGLAQVPTDSDQDNPKKKSRDKTQDSSTTPPGLRTPVRPGQPRFTEQPATPPRRSSAD